MCDFCLRHGEGRVWYLEAANHSRELMGRLNVEGVLKRHSERFETSTVRLLTIYDRLSPLWRIGPLKRLVHSWATRRQRKKHFGQVVPPEHLRSIFSLAGSVVRLPCTCRRFVKGRREARYCFGLGFDPRRVYGDHPDYRGDFELLTPEEAARLSETFRREERLVHTVWTMPTPFVASVCNCSMEECGALLTNFGLGINVLHPGELAAGVLPDRCCGCLKCLRHCPFDALTADRAAGKALVSRALCQGCGLCRDACPHEAIRLSPRNQAAPEEIRDAARPR